jgi:hypothetical protein
MFMRTILAISAFLLCLSTAYTQHHAPSDSPEVTVGVTQPGGQAAFFFAANGNDANDCSQATPCQSLTKAQSLVYVAGNNINFRGGDIFVGCWVLNANNVPISSASNPIVVQSYGTGRATLRANCPGNLTAQFGIQGVNGVIVQNLKFTAGGTQTAYGILLEGPGDTITITNVEVSGFNQPNGGAYGGEIGVFGLGVYQTQGCQPLNKITVTNSSLHGENGVTSPDDFGITGFGCGPNITNVEYSHNTIFNIGGHPNGTPGTSGNGIVVNSTHSGHVAFNLVHDLGANVNTCGGPGGLWAFNSDSIVFEFNEVHHVQPVGQGRVGCDFIAFDSDGGTTNNIWQYNYAHDNAGACFLIFPGAVGAVFRYNLCENNDTLFESGAQIAFASDGQVYNNTIWLPAPGTPGSVAGACWQFGFNATVSGFIRNNICYTGMANSFNTSWLGLNSGNSDLTALAIDHNLYFINSGSGQWQYNGQLLDLAGVQALGKDQGSRILDPLNTAPGTGGTCTWNPQANTGPQPCPPNYHLRAGSPAIGAGVGITGNGGRDYYGAPLSTPPNVGASQ